MILELNLKPSATLAPFVYSYDLIEADMPNSITDGIAMPMHAFFFHYGDPVILKLKNKTMTIPPVSINGVIDQSWQSITTGYTRMIIVKLKPMVLSMVSDGDAHYTMNNSIDWHSLERAPKGGALIKQLATTCSTVAEKISAVESWLLKALESIPIPTVGQTIADAALQLESCRLESLQHPYSERHFRRLFKYYLGVTPRAFYDMHRVKLACELLQQGKAITDVAVLLYFYDTAHFSKTFKRYSGQSPKSYISKLNINPFETFLHSTSEHVTADNL